MTFSFFGLIKGKDIHQETARENFKNKIHKIDESLKELESKYNSSNAAKEYDLTNFIDSCRVLYSRMREYSDNRTAASKFPGWLKKIVEPTDKDTCLNFLESIVKEGVPSRYSAWGYNELESIKSILNKIKELGIKFQNTYNDFDSDKLGFFGTFRRWKRSRNEWNIMKSSNIYKKLDQINSVDDMLDNLPDVWKNQDGTGPNEDFKEASYVLISSYATFVHDEFVRICKSYKVLNELSVKDPTKFKGSKKFKIISLLINYIIKNTINIREFEDLSIVYAGTHGVLVKVTVNENEKRYFKITDLDEVENIGDFVRTDSNKSETKQEKLSKIKNMSMYKRINTPRSHNNTRAAALEVEYLDNKKVDSILTLYEIALDVCEFFIDLHGLGYVHCDIKEDNLRITDKGTVVIDIDGIQSEGWGNRAGTPSNNKLSNTFRYLSPKKWLSISHFGKIWIDQTDDLYSFGKMMLRLIEKYKEEHKGLDEVSRKSLSGLEKIAKYCKNPGKTKNSKGERIVIAEDVYANIFEQANINFEDEDLKKLAEHINDHLRLRHGMESKIKSAINEDNNGKIYKINNR